MADLNIQLILRLVDKATAPARQAIGSLDSLSSRAIAAGKEQIALSREQIGLAQQRQSALLGEAGALAASGFAIVKSLQPAIAFEKEMAEVGKVVDFQASDGIARLGQDIQALVTSGGLPMAAEGVAAIVAAASQANLVDAALPDAEKRAELVAFADAAAKMGVAFDISAEAAGEAMAVWRASLGLTQERALLLGDAVNHLSNNMNAQAGDLTAVIQRQGAVAAASGLATQEVAALSAALLSGGARPEVAATALKNFTGALSAGTAMTARQRKVLQGLGFDAVELSKRMQVDARGAIIDVMEALAKLPEHEQGSSLKLLFGEESIGAIQPLLSNLDNLRRAFDLVSEEQNYAGAMTEEYSRVAATTAARLQVLGNYTNMLAVTAGTILLPMLLQLIEAVMPLLQTIADWVAANPELVKGIALIVAGLFALRLAILAGRFALIQFQIAFWLFNGALGAGAVAFGVASKAAIWFGSAIATLVRLKSLQALAGAIRGVGTALAIAGRAMLANPLILILTVIAGLAYVIYDNWSEIVEYFQAKVDLIAAAFDEGLLNGVLATLAEFNPFVMIYDAAEGLFTYLTGWNFGDVRRMIARSFGFDPFEKIAQAGRKLISWLSGWSLAGVRRKIADAFGFDPFEQITRAGQALWNWLAAWDFSAARRAFVDAFGFDPFEQIARAGQALWNWLAAWDFSAARRTLVDAFGFDPFVTPFAAARGFYDYVTGWTWDDVRAKLAGAFDIDLFQAGIDMIQSLLDGARAKFVAVLEWCRSLPSQIIAAIGEINLSGLFNMGLTSGAATQGVRAGRNARYHRPEGAPDPGRALGGPVRAGMIYRWQEEGRELFMPRVDGSVINAREVSALREMAEAPLSIRIAPAETAGRAAAGGPAGSARIDIGGITINAAPGMNPADIARAVRRELQAVTRQSGFALHDGGDHD